MARRLAPADLGAQRHVLLALVLVEVSSAPWSGGRTWDGSVTRAVLVSADHLGLEAGAGGQLLKELYGKIDCSEKQTVIEYLNKELKQ